MIVIDWIGLDRILYYKALSLKTLLDHKILPKTIVFDMFNKVNCHHSAVITERISL